jgi:hypothetical protein
MGRMRRLLFSITVIIVTSYQSLPGEEIGDGKYRGHTGTHIFKHEKYNTRVYPKVSGLAAWSENCKWYSSVPLGAVVSLFCESV